MTEIRTKKAKAVRQKKLAKTDRKSKFKLIPPPSIIKEKDQYYGEKININYLKTCECKSNHINCLTAGQWIKTQLGVWEFFYEKRDIRDKNLHPATYPISLAKKVIELFTHQGELVLDPFVGSGTTLLTA